MRWFYILILTIALTHTVSLRADDPTQAQAAVDAEKKNVDNSNKKFGDKLEEAKKAEEAYKKDPDGKQGDKTNKEIYEEKKKELAEAALDKVNADNALKSAQDRQAKLQGDTEDGHGHQSEGGSQSVGKSEADKAKDKATAEALKQAAAQKQQEEKKEEEKKDDEEPKQEATQTAEKEKPAQNNEQEEQVATIPEDIKKSLEAPYAKEDDSNSSSESNSKKPSSNGYDDLIKANNEFSAAKAKETSETLASLNAEKETAATEEASENSDKAAAKPVSVNEYIDGVVAQNSTSIRSPASTTSRTTTSGSAAPRAMKGTSSSRLLNSIK